MMWKLLHFNALNLIIKNIANSLHLDVEISSMGSETGGFVNLFTVANRTRELLLQFLMISES